MANSTLCGHCAPFNCMFAFQRTTSSNASMSNDNISYVKAHDRPPPWATTKRTYLHQRKGSDSAEICGTQDEFSIIQHSYDDLWFGKSIKQHIHWKFAQLNEDERMEVRTLNNRQIYRSRRNVWHAGLFIAPWSNLMCHHMRVNVCNFDGMYTFSSLMPGWVVFRPAGERY